MTALPSPAPAPSVRTTRPAPTATRPRPATERFAAPTRDLTIATTTTWHLTWAGTNGSRGDLGTIARSTTSPYRVQVEETVIRTPNA